MQLNPIVHMLASIVLLFAEAASAQCHLDAELAKRGAKFVADWTFIDQVYEEREPFRLEEVTRRIQELQQIASTGDASSPERIALVVALMDVQATLEWIAAQDSGSSAQFPKFEYEYRDARPHRGQQRAMVRAGLEAHPGDRFLVESMVALQGFDADFYSAQLEAAVLRDPTVVHLRESLVMFQLLNGNFEAARPHLIALLQRKPSCDDRGSVEIALQAVGWLHAEGDPCPVIRAKLGTLERRVLEAAKTSEVEFVSPLSIKTTLLSNALLARPDAVEPFLAGMAQVLSEQSCRPAADGS